jgi:hypothetical protein
VGLNALRGMNHQFNIRPEFANDESENVTEAALRNASSENSRKVRSERAAFGEPMLRQLEKIIMLQTLIL